MISQLAEMETGCPKALEKRKGHPVRGRTFAMSPIQPIITPVYLTTHQFRKRLQTAHPDAGAILQLAHDLNDGRIVVVDASARQAKRLARFISTAIGPSALAAATRH
jgi:hypothetical protein